MTARCGPHTGAAFSVNVWYFALFLAVFLLSRPVFAQTPNEESPPASQGSVSSITPDDEQDFDPTTPDYSGVEELLITGQISKKTVQDETASVQQFGALEIQSQNFQDLRDIASVTPNLEIKSSFAASSPTLFIRGVGLNDFNANSASAVAVYNDNIYMNSPVGQLGQIFDLESIQVLRGPQGTLYARNASAGVIRVISRKPSMNGQVSGNAVFSYGTYNTTELQLALETPIVDDTLAWRGAFRMNRRDGWLRNFCGGLTDVQSEESTEETCGATSLASLPIPPGLATWANDVNNWAGRSTLRWQTGDMDWILNFHGGKNDSLATQYHHVGTRPPGGYGTDDGRRYPNPANSYTELIKSDVRVGAYDLAGKEKLELYGGFLQGEVGVAENYKLEIIAGYERNHRKTQEDSDASPNPYLHSTWSNVAYQATGEVRLLSDYGDRFEWQTGIFYIYENLSVDNEFAISNRDFGQDYLQLTNSASGYLQTQFSLTDDFMIEGGIRYSWESKSMDLRAFLLGLGNTQNETLTGYEAKSWGGLSGNVTFTWQMLPDASTYIKYSHGFKGGHFNGGAVTSRQAIDPVEPETVDAFEVGLKSTWLDNTLSVNLAAFYYDYNDLQVFVIRNAPAASGDDSLDLAAPPIQKLINAQDARILGMEGSIEYSPWPDLVLHADFGILDSEYLDFYDSITVTRRTGPRSGVKEELIQNYSGNRLIASPEFSVSGYVLYTLSLGRYGFLEPRYDFSWRDATFFDPTEGVGLDPKLNFPKYALGQPAFILQDFRLAWRSLDERFEIAGWVKNLANQQYRTDAFNLSTGFDLILEVWAEPRTAGVTVTMNF